MNTEKKLNMTMLCDFYELTMGNGYYQAGLNDSAVCRIREASPSAQGWAS